MCNFASTWANDIYYTNDIYSANDIYYANDASKGLTYIMNIEPCIETSIPKDQSIL